MIEDHARGIVELKWTEGDDERSLFLRFTQKGLRLLKARMGLDHIGMVFGQLQDLDPENLQVAVWAGTQWSEGAQLEFEELDEAGYKLIQAAAAVTRGLSLAMWGTTSGPTDEDKAAGEDDDTESPPIETSNSSGSERSSASSNSTH